jgi:hypothetical protein
MRIRLRHVYSGFFVVLALVLLGCAPAAWALGPAGDVFFGYSHLGNDAFYQNAGGLDGWEAAFNLKLKPLLGAEADVSHYGLGATAAVPRTTVVLVGPRLTVGIAGIHLFVHGLVGGEHSANSSKTAPVSGGALAVAFGGGADVPIAPFFAWRVAADYLNAPTETPSSGSHERISTGLVFRF